MSAPALVLFARESRPCDTAAEVQRAHAHRLLDGARLGLQACNDAEIARALWVTGDARPVGPNHKGLADLDKARRQKTMT